MKPGFYAASRFGRDLNKLKVASVPFATQAAAADWAEFLNITSPKHFVIQVPAELKE